MVDKPWLTQLFYEAGLEMTFQLSPLENILSEAQMDIWHQTKNNIFKNSNITRHRASSDAWSIQETFAQTLQASQA